MAEENDSFVKQVNKIFDENKDNKNEELFFTFKGVLYPNRLCSAETFEALETFEARKDDMLLIAYPKCGTNWVFQILIEMVTAISSNKESPLLRHHLMLEFGSREKFLKMKEQLSPRYYATHLHYDDIPKSFLEKKVKMLVVFRNPKDAATSYYHFYNKNPLLPTPSSWDDFFQKFMRGEVAWKSYFDHALAWDKHMDEENIMIITYEELKENLLDGVQRIADFYELPLSDEIVKSIADKATFQAMSSKSPEIFGQFASVIFRKGEVGNWRTLFTEAQSKEMDAKFEACLAGTKLGSNEEVNPGISKRQKILESEDSALLKEGVFTKDVTKKMPKNGNKKISQKAESSFEQSNNQLDNEELDLDLKSDGQASQPAQVHSTNTKENKLENINSKPRQIYKEKPSQSLRDQGDIQETTLNQAVGIDTSNIMESQEMQQSSHINKPQRTACQYGKSCYRKNPVHFQQFSHPGDSDYHDLEALTQVDDDRPECPYGTACYRKNPQHKLEYKHTASPESERRQTRSKVTRKDESDDDGEPNEYNLNDSFIDDDEEEECDPTDEDSDWEPDCQDDDEDTDMLLKEAHDFVKTKN